ncbi:MAG: TraR/DksA C4-type zinc finger protein [Actinomycetota bacterium]|nr:TraR/DksA C4-type zinc finger protein [Actinomycetota bacterium]
MAAKKTSAVSADKSVAAKTTDGKRAPAKNAAAGVTAPKTAAKKSSAKQPAAKKTDATRPATKAAASKAATGKAATGKAASNKAVAQKAPAKKAPAKTATAKKAATGSKPNQERAAAKTAPAKTTSRAKARRAKNGSSRLAVREGERQWTAGEIAEVRETLDFDATRLKSEIVAAEREIGQLLRAGSEGAGNDQADVGSNTFERDHEMSMVKNARENLELVQEAVRRIDAGSYGVCESCDRPIGKMRLQAFPRATLCMECKQRQERR